MRCGASWSLAFVLFLSAFASACRTAAPPPPEVGNKRAVSSGGTVPCAVFAAALRTGDHPFRTLMRDSSSTYTNDSNGQTVRFLAVRPGTTSAAGNPTVVFFDGTSQITPDWPVDMLVSSSGSLCDHAALVFFDYPGIGETTYPGNTSFTFDAMSDDVYHLLANLDASGDFEIGEVDPLGWSLGTASAIKFATLAASNQAFKTSGMSIGKLFLIAVKAGGDLNSSPPASPSSCAEAARATPTSADDTTYYPAVGHQAMCATSVLGQLLEKAHYEGGVKLKTAFGALTFPYVDTVPVGQVQTPYGSGDPATICAATVGDFEVKSLCNLESGHSIETACDADSTSECTTAIALFKSNREEPPYFNNLAYDTFYGERQMIFHFDYGSCSSASTTAWQSTGCQFNPNQTGDKLYDSALVVDGSPCLSVVTTSENASPTIPGCPGLSNAPFSGVKFYVWNGEEDLLIRHDYGEVLCTWLSSNNFPCAYHSFANAGHAVLFTWASEMYTELDAALAISR